MQKIDALLQHVVDDVIELDTSDNDISTNVWKVSLKTNQLTIQNTVTTRVPTNSTNQSAVHARHE
jgi:hypothetical protein